MTKNDLPSLLAWWRRVRHPRIANVIEQLVAPLTKPVKAATVPVRTKACISLAKSKDPMALGHVLASEWPGTWQHALPLLKAVLENPDDPRMAMHFARQIDRTQYDTYTSKTYWQPLFKRLTTLRDVRTLELLELQLTRAKPEYYARDMRRLEEAVVKALRRVKVPSLSSADEARLAELEAPFAAGHSSRRDTQRSAQQLLDAVYAKPDDLGLRAVYGDWLAQQGDPRGEFIALQLGAPSAKSEARQRTLLNAHWTKWVGPLRDWFRTPPMFTAGFLSSADLEAPSYEPGPDTLRNLLARPEWRTLEHVRGWPWRSGANVPLAEALAHPNFCSVRRVDGVSTEDLQALCAAGHRGLKELSFGRVELDVELERLPSLRRLTLRADELPFVSTLALGRLEHLVVAHAATLTDAQWERLERAKVRSVELFAGARVTVRGTQVELADLSDVDAFMAFVDALPRALTRVTALEPIEVTAANKKALTKAFSRFKGLEVSTLPFVDPKPKPKLPFATVTLTGAKLLSEAKVKALWPVVTSLGASFDSFSVNGGSKRPLLTHPLAQLKEWAKHAKTNSLVLFSSTQPAQVALERTRGAVLTLPYEPSTFPPAVQTLAVMSGAAGVRLVGPRNQVLLDASGPKLLEAVRAWASGEHST